MVRFYNTSKLAVELYLCVTHELVFVAFVLYVQWHIFRRFSLD